MKKLFLSAMIIAFFASGFWACNTVREWTQEQRQSLRQSLKAYREMMYLNDLNDTEFTIFTDQVVSALEAGYPVYTEFVSMPAVGDTVDMVVVETIVEALDTDARNMRHLYPYRQLTREGILPEGLTHEQRQSFYKCLAGKVNATYPTMTSFVQALISDTTSHSSIRKMQNQCANDLFNWTFTEVEVISAE